MRFRFNGMILTLLMMGLLLYTLPAFGAGAVVGVLEKRGKGVQVIRADGGRISGKEVPIFAGDRIETAPGKDCRMRYSDGTVLTIYPNTSVMLAQRIYGKEKDAQIEKEIHLSLGRVEFKAESGSRHQLRLISLTTAKAYIGDAVTFETDGIFTYVNQEEVMLGDLLEMPETPQVVEGKRSRKGKSAADRIGEEYIETIRSIIE